MEGLTAVLAGTPVDTRMGVDCLAARGVRGLAFPLSSDPWKQTAFQYAPPEERRGLVLQVLEEAMDAGCERAFVYCNSLSGAVDFSLLAAETGLRIVTPLDAYRLLAPRYQCLGVIAANAQGLSGIEKVLLKENPSLKLLGACALPAVVAVESGMAPGDLVERFHLPSLSAWLAGCGAEALVLGCTHFPYFQEALAKRTSLPLLDPADEMFRLLTA